MVLRRPPPLRYDLCTLIKAKHPKKVDLEELAAAQSRDDDAAAAAAAGADGGSGSGGVGAADDKDRTFRGRTRRWCVVVQDGNLDHQFRSDSHACRRP